MRIVLLIFLFMAACERAPEPNYLKTTYCFELIGSEFPSDKFAGELTDSLRLINITREKLFIINPIDRRYVSGLYLYVETFEPL